MFDFVAKHKRLLQGFLLLLIVPPFAFFGIQGFERMWSGGTSVAEVDGDKVSAQEFNRALDQQRNQLRSVMGQAFDPALLDTPAARKRLLEGLIEQRVLASYMARNGLSVSDNQVRDLVLAEPAFQEDGKFSRARYEAFLRSQGESEAYVEAQLRSELAARQLAGGLADSGFAAKALAQRLAALRGESREVSESMLAASQFLPLAKLPADAVEQYYKTHLAEFESPEQLRAEYVVLSQDALITDEPVSADEVKAVYEAVMAPRFREQAEARKKAESILAEVRRDPSKFAEIAKANSQDAGSAAQGGDLGWFGRGALVKPFEDAAFKLKLNEISSIVASEFGFHIIKLTGIRRDASGKGEERRASHILINAPGDVKDFEGARPDIERDLKRQRASKKFPELAESFSNLADDQPDSLQPVAEKFHLKVVTTDWFSRQAAPPPLNNPKLAAALFADDAIRNKRNTEAVETAPGSVVVARVLEHRAATTRPLADVRAEIERKLTAEAALRLAREAGLERLKALQTGAAPALPWGPPHSVSRENPNGIDRRAIAPILGADASKLPAYVGVDLTPAGYAIYRVAKVTPAPAIDDAKLRAYQTGLARQEARAAYDAFTTALRADAKVEINEANLARK